MISEGCKFIFVPAVLSVSGCGQRATNTWSKELSSLKRFLPRSDASWQPI